MKVNEAPEKIYLYPSDRAGEDYEDEWGTMPWGEDYVEYTRTDAFIEKACEWLEPQVMIMLVGDKIDTDKFIGDFKKAMKL